MVVIRASRVLIRKERLPESSAYFVLKIELLLPVVLNFEREADLKGLVFDG